MQTKTLLLKKSSNQTEDEESEAGGPHVVSHAGRMKDHPNRSLHVFLRASKLRYGRSSKRTPRVSVLKFSGHASICVLSWFDDCWWILSLNRSANVFKRNVMSRALEGFVCVIGKHSADTSTKSKRNFPNALRDRATLDALQEETGAAALSMSLDGEEDTVRGTHRCVNVLRVHRLRRLAFADAEDGWPGLSRVNAVFLDYVASVPQYIYTPLFGQMLSTLHEILPAGAVVFLPTHVASEILLNHLHAWCEGFFDVSLCPKEKNALWVATDNVQMHSPHLIRNSGDETFIALKSCKIVKS